MEKITKNDLEKFNKEQLKSSKEFQKEQDIISAIIDENETLTKEEAKKKIEKFKKERVK